MFGSCDAYSLQDHFGFSVAEGVLQKKCHSSTTSAGCGGDLGKVSGRREEGVVESAKGEVDLSGLTLLEAALCEQEAENEDNGAFTSSSSEPLATKDFSSTSADHSTPTTVAEAAEAVSEEAGKHASATPGPGL